MPGYDTYQRTKMCNDRRKTLYLITSTLADTETDDPGKLSSGWIMKASLVSRTYALSLQGKHRLLYALNTVLSQSHLEEEELVFIPM